MASSKEYLHFVLDLLQGIEGITYKKMMGEYLLYKDDVLFGGVYDDRFLIKKNESLSGLGLKEEIPYPGAKAMYLIDSDNPKTVEKIVDKALAFYISA